MKMLLIALSLVSISAFACEDVELKDNAEICYVQTRSEYGKFTSHQITDYVLEFECTKTKYIQGDTGKDRLILGEYAIPNKKVYERVSRTKKYNTLSYCKSVAEHIEKNGEYPGVLDQMDYFGKALGM